MLDEVSILRANEGICKDGEKFSSYSLLSFFLVVLFKTLSVANDRKSIKSGSTHKKPVCGGKKKKTCM